MDLMNLSSKGDVVVQIIVFITSSEQVCTFNGFGIILKLSCLMSYEDRKFRTYYSSQAVIMRPVPLKGKRFCLKLTFLSQF